MTEDQIERIVEQRTDALDRRFLAGYLTRTEYDAEARLIDRWATEQYRTMGRVET